MLNLLHMFAYTMVVEITKGNKAVCVKPTLYFCKMTSDARRYVLFSILGKNNRCWKGKKQMKPRFKRILAAAFSAVLWSAAACGCSGGTPVTDSSVPPSQAVEIGTVGIYSSFSTLPVREYPEYISDGYSCEVKEFAQYTQPLEALTSGEADVCVAPLPAVLRAQLEGKAVKILCNFYQKGSALVTGSGQEISSIEELAGKTVGYTDGSMEYAQLRAQLYNRQLDAAAVTWKSMEPDELNGALKTGEIDAYCGDAALAGTAFMEGYGKVLAYPYADDLGYGNLVLVTTESKIEEKRDWIQEIVNTNYQVMEMEVSLDGYGLKEAESLGLNAQGITQEQDNYEWVWDMEEEYVMFTRNLCNYFYELKIFKEMPDMNILFDFTFLETRSQEFVR